MYKYMIFSYIIEGNLCSTGEAGSSLSYVHMTYPDLLTFSMHEKNRTESIITQRGKYIHCICM